MTGGSAFTGVGDEGEIGRGDAASGEEGAPLAPLSSPTVTIVVWICTASEVTTEGSFSVSLLDTLDGTPSGASTGDEIAEVYGDCASSVNFSSPALPALLFGFPLSIGLGSAPVFSASFVPSGVSIFSAGVPSSTTVAWAPFVDMPSALIKSVGSVFDFASAVYDESSISVRSRPVNSSEGTGRAFS